MICFRPRELPKHNQSVVTHTRIYKWSSAGRSHVRSAHGGGTGAVHFIYTLDDIPGAMGASSSCFLGCSFSKSFNYAHFLRICIFVFLPRRVPRGPASYGGKPITVSSMALAQGEEQKDLVRAYLASSKRNDIPYGVAIGTSVEATLMTVVWTGLLQASTPNVIFDMKI